ncbi:hypothetical protein ABD87_15105 [Lysinibacillus sphaericus]|uniref:DUF3850 domain-containing protein n=1 Tax=Lysinibacillus sphaericus TaxID=1421 RepID=UPI0018CE897D|nr:DUF3850 domain-containing protein [Lysinibacillus sphaericus]MBG9730817.1 hypothetical protein [Lysinibacillus sphaericus]
MIKRLFKSKRTGSPLKRIGVQDNNSSILVNYNPNEWDRIVVNEQLQIGSVCGSLQPKSVTVKTITSPIISRRLLVHNSKSVHEIEIDTIQFRDIKLGLKNFIIHEDNIHFNFLDLLNIFEFKEGEKTGYNALFTIKYIEKLEQKHGFLVMSIVPYTAPKYGDIKF